MNSVTGMTDCGTVRVGPDALPGRARTAMAADTAPVSPDWLPPVGYSSISSAASRL